VAESGLSASRTRSYIQDGGGVLGDRRLIDVPRIKAFGGIGKSASFAIMHCAFNASSKPVISSVAPSMSTSAAPVLPSHDCGPFRSPAGGPERSVMR
jgi:hypothetical protein